MEKFKFSQSSVRTPKNKTKTSTTQENTTEDDSVFCVTSRVSRRIVEEFIATVHSGLWTFVYAQY